MLCKKEGCPGDMKYFNRYGAEGYECPICHFKTFIHAHDLDLSGTEGLETFISHDRNGNLIIDDGIVEAYFKATSHRPTS